MLNFFLRAACIKNCSGDWLETTAEKKCSDASVSLFNRAYLTSPNYPSKYYSGATCRWTVYVQKFQSIRFVLFDFELDVKRAGRCLDYLEIIAGGKIYFRDCGALGKQVIEVGDHRTAVVTFTTGHTSLTQRGFLIYFEGKMSFRRQRNFWHILSS